MFLFIRKIEFFKNSKAQIIKQSGKNLIRNHPLESDFYRIQNYNKLLLNKIYNKYRNQSRIKLKIK